MTNQLYEDEARAKILSGAEKLYKAVKTTLGPKGRNVVIGSKDRSPILTHDGVTVARSVVLKDEAENIGAELIKEAADKLNDVAGDGTTTVTVLTYHILKEAEKLIKAGANPMILSKEVEKALAGVLEYLDELKIPADDIETLTKIATLSSGSSEIGEIVADVVYNVGVNGTVAVEPAPRPETTSELIQGVHIDSGYLSRYMVTNPAKMEAIYDKGVPVIILARKIYSFREILPVLSKVDEKMKQALIICEDIEGDTLSNLLLNSTQGKFRTLVVKAPSFGDTQRQLLDDIAIATGATVISKDTVSIEDFTEEHIGFAQTVISDNVKTTIVGAGGDITDRLNIINELIDNSTDDYDKKKLEQRRANLLGKVGIIKVGGQTDTEIEEKKFRVDDAVAATRVALTDGVLPGGGVTLYKAPVGDKTQGAVLLAKILKEPFKQLIENSGMNIKACEQNIEISDGSVGYNVKTGELVNLWDSGIVDAYIVTKQAITTAVSLGVAGMTMGALVVEDSE